MRICLSAFSLRHVRWFAVLAALAATLCPVLAEPPRQVIQTPDGVTVEVRLPDGATEKERIRAALEAALRQLDQPAAPPAPRVEPALVRTEAASEPALPTPVIHGPIETLPDDLCCMEGPLDQPWHITWIPRSLLWQPPLAQPGQPRNFVMLSSAREYYTKDTVDTGIGGTIGLFRYGPCNDDQYHAFQLDWFGVVLSRFSMTSRLIAADYRTGLIGTFAWGNWAGKIGYEHTSTHIGDEYLEVTRDFRREVIRDELVIALSYRWWNQLRVYGQGAYTFDIRTPGNENQRDRWNFGAEWYHNVKTTCWGQPFAACDFDIRGEQDYNVNFTGQLGWMWRDPAQRPFFRLVAQYYNGRSPYGHFSNEDENWFGLGAFLDY
jgi:hypothetical protein